MHVCDVWRAGPYRVRERAERPVRDGHRRVRQHAQSAGSVHANERAGKGGRCAAHAQGVRGTFSFLLSPFSFLLSPSNIPFSCFLF